jgi:hypothetical protein
VPPALPPAAVALRAGTCEGLKKCDAGKGDECPNDPQLHKDRSLLVWITKYSVVKFDKFLTDLRIPFFVCVT